MRTTLLTITALLGISAVNAATLAPGQVITITFSSIGNNSDLLLAFCNVPLALTGSPVITTKLYNGSTLLGSAVGGPNLYLGGYYYGVVFKSFTSTYTPYLQTPATVDLSSMENGTIQGSMQISVSGGTISGFDVSLLGNDPNAFIVYDAQNAGGGGYYPEGDLYNQTVALVTPPAGLEFYPVTPCRIADTRVSSFPFGFGPPSLAAGSTRTFSVLSSSCASGIPSTAAAYSLNFTVVPPSGGPAANLTTWPTGVAMPNASTLNYYGSVVANAAIVPAGTNGAINVYANFATDMLFDINGYFAPPSTSGLAFYPLTPCRVADTRVSTFPSGFGPPSLLAGTTRTFNIPNSPCATTIPANVAAYSFNFTAVPPSGGPAGNLTTWPTGLVSGIPNVSTLNFSGSVVANAAIVPAGTGDAINVFVNDPANVLFDINGYFAPLLSSGLKLYPITPCRIADTRVSSFASGYGPPSLAAGATRNFNMLSSNCAIANAIPAAVAAYSLNFTVIPPSSGTAANLTVWPVGLAIPNVSTLNYYGLVVANAAIVPAGTNGAISVNANLPTDMLFDINGYFAP